MSQYGLSPKAMTSHMTIPKLHTSLAEVNFRYAIASGAVQRMGIFPPCRRKTYSVKQKQNMELWKQIMQFIPIHLWRLKCLREIFLLTSNSPISTYTCGVCPLRIVLQHPWQAEVRNFTLQGVVNEDVPGSQVAVDIAHVREVLHAGSDASQHAHQLEGGKLSVVVLIGKTTYMKQKNSLNKQNE